jgi:P-type conjugative transfer protein TrbG
MLRFPQIIITALFLVVWTAPGIVVAEKSNFAPIVASDGSLRYPYGKAQPTLTCRPLYVCDIALQSGEAILDLAIGDSVRWIISPAQSGPNGNTPHVFVKPTQLDLDTNFVITTTRRVYYLRLISSSYTEITRIGFYYPEDEAADAVAAASASAQRRHQKSTELPLLPANRLDYDYRIQGDKFLLPQRVYNDGVHTFIEYGTLPMDLPVLFAVAPDGSNQMVNFRLRKNVFIVDGIPSGVDLVLNAGTGKHGRGERHVFIRHK